MSSDKNMTIDGLAVRKSKRVQPINAKLAEKNIDIVSVKRNNNLKEKKTSVDDSQESTPVQTINANEEFMKPVENFDFNISSKEIDLKKKNLDKNRKAKGTKKKKHVPRTILIIILVLLVLTFGAGMVLGDKIISKITGGNSGIWDVFQIKTDSYTPLKTDSNGRTNILLFGTSGYDMEGSEGNGSHAGSQLTDSIMFFSIDQKTGDIAMTSLPRDLRVGKTCTATGKVNEIYWCNNMYGDNEEAGAQALMSKMEEMFGVEFQYYIHVDWQALVEIVDSVGGITVTLDESVSDFYYTGSVIEAGVPTELNGTEALALARARHGTVGGDFSRGASQQKILIALKDKIISNGLDLNSALALVNSLGDNVRTNFTLDEIKTGVHILQELNLNNMRQVSLMDYNNDIYYMTTGSIDGISYVLPLAGDGVYGPIREYLARMYNSDPMVREEPTIIILNGTEKDGVGSEEKANLTEEGITITAVENAPEGDYKGTLIYKTTDKKPETEKMLEQYYGISELLTKEELPENIDSNYDFIIIIGN